MTEQPKVVKWYIKALWALGIPLTVVLSIILWWLLSPAQPVTYSNYKLVVSDEKTYSPGDTVTVRSTGTYCNQGVETRVERRLENEFGGLVLPPVFFFAPKDPVCIDNTTFRFEIPGDIPSGPWRLTIVTSYKPNPVITVEETNSTNIFEVQSDHDK
jgi:hypothetical protein